MCYQQSPSESTEAIAQLLQSWPRQVVQKALFSRTDPLRSLQSGDVRNCLEQEFATKRRHYPLSVVGASEAGTSVLGVFDAQFPEVLKVIPDPPLLLFYRGNLQILSHPSVAIVGARRATQQGKSTALLFAHDLARRGFVIASGLAYGIDAAAHTGALEAGGDTIAVLGSGLNNIYPKNHLSLARSIVRHGGLILSEYPLSQAPLPYQFPERNRIISGLCNGVVVVEAGLKSGSLITARLALEQGRDVFAVPGPVTSMVSQGCHRLIRDGAELITSVDQVVETLGLPEANGPMPDLKPETQSETKVVLRSEQQYLLSLIQGYRVTLDELIVLTNWSSAKLSQELVQMELAGIVHAGMDGYIASP